jgi:predicted Fe-Mo cluster-binding NifX family protein
VKIAVSSNGNDLDATVSPVFGRCPAYVFVDSDTLQFEAITNPAISAPGGAGIQAAEMVVNQGAQAVITNNVGPNAFSVLAAAGAQVFLAQGGTVRQAVEAFKAGQLPSLSGPSAGMHAGMGMGMGRGRGGGGGRGMGGGMGRGMGGGWASYGPNAPSVPPSSQGVALPQTELEELKAQVEALREQLAQVLDRIDAMEEKG